MNRKVYREKKINVSLGTPTATYKDYYFYVLNLWLSHNEPQLLTNNVPLIYASEVDMWTSFSDGPFESTGSCCDQWFITMRKSYM